MDKLERQQRILRLVRERAIRSQQEIVGIMAAEGFGATQASISRDIRELGLVKVGGRYHSPGAMEEPPAAGRDPLFELITGIVPVGANLIVLRTRAGGANSVAAALDARSMPEVVGTVAGDDTIFIAVRSRSDQGRLYARIRRWAPAR